MLNLFLQLERDVVDISDGKESAIPYIVDDTCCDAHKDKATAYHDIAQFGKVELCFMGGIKLIVNII